nr:translation initiation factor IF-2 [Oryctolagus cuniculus]
MAPTLGAAAAAQAGGAGSRRRRRRQLRRPATGTRRRLLRADTGRSLNTEGGAARGSAPPARQEQRRPRARGEDPRPRPTAPAPRDPRPGRKRGRGAPWYAPLSSNPSVARPRRASSRDPGRARGLHRPRHARQPRPQAAGPRPTGPSVRRSCTRSHPPTVPHRPDRSLRAARTATWRRCFCLESFTLFVFLNAVKTEDICGHGEACLTRVAPGAAFQRGAAQQSFPEKDPGTLVPSLLMRTFREVLHDLPSGHVTHNWGLEPIHLCFLPHKRASGLANFPDLPLEHLAQLHQTIPYCSTGTEMPRAKDSRVC